MNKATHILATDLDGTLVGDKDALKDLLSFYEEQDYDVSLVYVTGRHYHSALSLIDSEHLPLPDILITDVGTEIRYGRPLQLDAEWAARMAAGWNFKQVEEIAASIPNLAPQNLPVVSRAAYETTDPEILKTLEQKLTEAGIAHKLIYSSGRDVDILPAGSGKGKALQYVLDKFALQDANILVAGDSGNDLEMLTLGHPSVMVGNARPELLEIEESPLIFRATKHCAGGIQEAWTHFHT